MKRRFIRCLAALLALFCLCPGGIAEEEKPRLTDAQLYSFYDGALFVGDSITRQFQVFIIERRREDGGCLAGARFQTAQSYFLYTASRKLLMPETNNLHFQGRDLPLWEIIELMKPSKVLILLGVNDYIGEKIEKGVGYAERIIDLAAQASPDTQIIFESLTPVAPAFCRKKDYRPLWDQYNQALEAMCRRRGAGYVDIATALKDEDGYLRADYSSDGEYHLNRQGLQVWLDQLLNYAQAQYDLGLWAPEEGSP